jgi:ubiquinone/menaquinone biosynthesis C-methylase UbiE
MQINEAYYLPLLIAFVRGSLKSQCIDNQLFTKNIQDLSESEIEVLLTYAQQHDLKTYNFKQNRDLPRVAKIMSWLRAVRPQSLLDIGTGRGAFLYPFLSEFTDCQVLSIDILAHRLQELEAIVQGGLPNLKVQKADIQSVDWPDASFEAITALEVIEHIPDTEQVIKQLYRLAQKHIFISVPSKPDDNPEHIHLFDEARFKELFAPYPNVSLKFEQVQNHWLVWMRKLHTQN